MCHTQGNQTRLRIVFFPLPLYSALCIWLFGLKHAFWRKEKPRALALGFNPRMQVLLTCKGLCR
ncbi:hypothetical protein B0I35DRAFT_433808 [Stachybotrys elegans]|uniref:Uncharacterized protein n=1 Tax=Stachybotrys elegans TaxID=80388 RepID=A0A8K0WQD5_9HYPO|nr:hypothetical protein B0I35DRAFT_433808 [Stachybotrys elegans]